MKYLTLAELKDITALVEFLGERMGNDLAFECTVIDLNGETLGRVGYTDGGSYGFIPVQDAEGDNAELS